jgi:hypothetical protein
MERSQILETMGGLKLYGMKAAYDEVIAAAVKRQHEPQRIVGTGKTHVSTAAPDLRPRGSRVERSTAGQAT